MGVNGRTGFTPTEQKMLAILADGLPHTQEELHACLYDDLGRLGNIHMHISNIRKILRPCGESIICEFFRRKRWYRHVRLLASAVDGKT